MNPHKQKWLDENKKLYPLKEGGRLECVESDASLWTKGKVYTANHSGFIFDDWGNACFTSEKDATNLGLFRRVDEARKAEENEWCAMDVASWYGRNKSLYPLKWGDSIECVDAFNTTYWTAGKTYQADINGFIRCDVGSNWFTSDCDVPGRVLFRRVKPESDKTSLAINITDANGNPVSADLLRKLADMLEGKA